MEKKARRGTKPQNKDALFENANNYGVYLFAKCGADENYNGKKVEIAEDKIIYAGKSGLQTFYERWTNTHDAWEKLGEIYKNDRNGTTRFFYSVAVIEHQKISLRLWSEEMQILGGIYIEDLEKETRKLLQKRNAYYQTHKIGS